MRSTRILGFAGLLGLFASSQLATAAVIRITEANFVAGSGLITFSEVGFPVGTVNPTYTAAQYGGGVGSPTVTFEGFFTGQALGTALTCPAGAALTGCVVGSPTGPLSLDAAAPNTSIVNDGAVPTSPVLSGTPVFNGPIAILFSVDVAGVGLQGGFSMRSAAPRSRPTHAMERYLVRSRTWVLVTNSWAWYRLRIRTKSLVYCSV